ncbi:MAG: hypothetical protein EPO67_21860 [Reyranella sp.]|jgi:hypothetical protein|nr:MAG: hypothetical protein EPO67_21860 [Reyranella sp.]
MKTIARVYDSYGQASQVVADLEAAGCASSDINIIANRYVCEESVRAEQPSGAGAGAGIGAALGGTAGLLAGLGVIAIPGLGPVVAAGALAATAVGAAAGAATGGMVGALVASGVPAEEAEVYCEAVRRGGTMVSVRVSEANESRALRIMDQHRPIDYISREADYRKSGWTRFDPKAEPYTPNQAEIERLRRPYMVDRT